MPLRRDHPRTAAQLLFVFYAERHDAIFIMSSEEFIAEAAQNENGNNAGMRSLWFNGTRENPKTGEREEYIRSGTRNTYVGTFLG